MFALSAVSAAMAQQPCHVLSKQNSLARDQRDEKRLSCLRQKVRQLTVGQCLNIAQSMEYSTNAEDAKLICLYDLQPSLKECVSIAKSMEYPDSGDEARWGCLRRFNKGLTEKQCRLIAKSMSYPANSQRAVIFCAQELQ